MLAVGTQCVLVPVMDTHTLIAGLHSDWAAWDLAATDAYRRGDLASCRRCFEAQTRLEVALSHLGALAEVASRPVW